MNPSAQEVGGRIKVTYSEGSDTYSKDYSLSELQGIHKFFYIPTNNREVVDHLNKASQVGKVTPYVRGNDVDLSYYLMMGMQGEDVHLTLPKEQRYVPPPQPRYQPPPQPRYQPPPQPYRSQPKTTTHTCNCPLDHERIDKLEKDSRDFMSNDTDLEGQIDQLRSEMEELKRRNSQIRNDNDALDKKTEQIKQRYLQLVEEEARLRDYVEELKRNNQELRLRIIELEFLVKDQHQHDGISEVYVPLDETRNSRVTQVQQTTINDQPQTLRSRITDYYNASSNNNYGY